MIPQSPDVALNCLLIQPAFAGTNYWNYKGLARDIGAYTPAPPLGLLTVAAILPQTWRFKLVDLNVCELTELDWADADIVCTGGMLPQQAETLKVIEAARARGKFVVVGGPDVTSQPEIYDRAQARVLGEGEKTIPIWIESWRNGQPDGLFESEDRPDVTSTPQPRFDLIQFNDYVHIGVQFSRGCPFNCEFCDIIELYGRRPRSKTTAQFLKELDQLFELGYRGWVDVVDDNFIGNKKFIKPMLVELAEWQKAHKYPFFFSTEASMNVADDDDLLHLMQECDFRYIFMGIETPDPGLLQLTQKSMNAYKPVADRIQRVYDRGISVTAGFILGFDNEQPGSGEAIRACVTETAIVMAMAGLLTALPNTQLARRLMAEKRLISAEATLITTSDGPYRVSLAGTSAEGADQSTGGLNFVTTRDRVEIYQEYKKLIEGLYGPKVYMDRVLDMARRVKANYRHQLSLNEFSRSLRGLVRTAWKMSWNPRVRKYYWRNFFQSARLGMYRFDLAQRMASMYLHFEPITDKISYETDVSIYYAEKMASYPRQVGPDYVPDAKKCGSGAGAAQGHSQTVGSPSTLPLVTIGS